MALLYHLNRGCLTNVEDKAGIFQIEGGKVTEKDKHVANYTTVRRTSCGTTEQNTAMTSTTLFFFGANPPENMTLLGAHNFNSGDEIGSVAAASNAFASHIGKQFKLTAAATLTIV